jgi:hypothetical protein
MTMTSFSLNSNLLTVIEKATNFLINSFLEEWQNEFETPVFTTLARKLTGQMVGRIVDYGVMRFPNRII